jgi:hypothetical protein
MRRIRRCRYQPRRQRVQPAACRFRLVQHRTLRDTLRNQTSPDHHSRNPAGHVDRCAADAASGSVAANATPSSGKTDSTNPIQIVTLQTDRDGKHRPHSAHSQHLSSQASFSAAPVDLSGVREALSRWAQLSLGNVRKRADASSEEACWLSTGQSYP